MMFLNLCVVSRPKYEKVVYGPTVVCSILYFQSVSRQYIFLIAVLKDPQSQI